MDVKKIREYFIMQVELVNEVMKDIVKHNANTQFNQENMEDKIMMQIIKFTDVDVDGCGTNVEVYVQVEGKSELTNGIIERTKEEIEKYKEENSGEWDTDSIIDVACEYLETEGYMCHAVIPHYEIEF